MAFRWRTDDDPSLIAGLVFQGIRTNIARKPYIFVIFQEWGSGLSAPLPFWIRACVLFSGQTHSFLHLSCTYRVVGHLK